MHNQQKVIPITLIASSLLFLGTAILSWYLLGQVNASDEVMAPAVILMLRIGLIAAILLLAVLLFKQIRAPMKNRANNLAMQVLIDNATQDTEHTRSTIIRLRQILEPDQVALAVSIASLLDKLLADIKEIRGEQTIDQEQHLSITKAASDLLEQHEQLKKAPNSRSEFLSRMGDEITMPMKSLGDMLNLLKKIELSNESRDLLIIATHSAHSLIENLSNILTFSKLDANLLELRVAKFDVTETLASVIEAQESIALAKGLLIETQIKPDVAALVSSDQKFITKILSNLISNAIRFTGRGQIQVVVDNQLLDGKRLLRFTIIDTGVGIPDSALSTLFDSLDRDTELVNSSFTGRLRLIVSKQLCELMGGEIGVRSVQGTGSQFWFTVDISR